MMVTMIARCGSVIRSSTDVADTHNVFGSISANTGRVQCVDKTNTCPHPARQNDFVAANASGNQREV